MAQMTLEQQRAIATAKARMRMEEDLRKQAEQQAQPQSVQPSAQAQPSPADLYSGQTLRIGNIDTGVPLSEDVFKFLAGAGARFADIPLAAQGIAQRVSGTPEQLAQTTQEIEQKRALERPLMETGAGQAGALATDIALTLGVPGGGATTAGRVAMAGAAGAGLELTKPVTQYESLLGQAAIGGATGAAAQGIFSAAGKAGKALASRFTEQKSRELEKVLNVAVQEGVDLDLAQATGNRFYEQVKSRLTKLPFTATKQAEVIAKQREQFSRSVLKRAGINAPQATEEVMDSAYKRLNKTFESLVEDTDILIDQKDLAKLRGIGEEVRAIYGPNSNQAGIVDAQINRIFGRLYPGKAAGEAAADVAKAQAALQPFSGLGVGAIEGVATRTGKSGVTGQDKMFGPSYRALRTELSNLAYGMTKPQSQNRDLSPYLSQMVSILDDSVGKTLGKEQQAAWAKARSEWGTLSAIVNNNLIEPDFTISPSRLYNVVRQQNKKGFATGKAKLGDLARLGKQLQDKMPDSGTAANLALDRVLSPGAALLAGGGTLLTEGETDQAIKNAMLAGGASFLFQKGAQSLFNSKTLTNILLNRTKPQQSVINTVKQIEKELGRKIPVKVRQSLSTTLKNMRALEPQGTMMGQPGPAISRIAQRAPVRALSADQIMQMQLQEDELMQQYMQSQQMAQ